LESAEDRTIWEFAAREGYTILSKDAYFRQRSFLLGHPPKVIWIRIDNCSTTQVASLIRERREGIARFVEDRGQAFPGLA
jgi:predicted nuclease of predicted toxin-antitoxin system